MAQAMALYDVPKIIIALHKTLQGNFSFYKTVLYQAELPSMGSEMRDISTWNPEFEVHSIAVRGALPDESGCALASLVKYRLELEAMRSVTVWCRPCTTLQACGDKHEVEKKNPKAKCIEGDCQNGQGAYTRADGDIYQGGFKNGLKDGQGTYTWADGAIYQGGFKNGKADGHGTKTFDSSGEKYQGEYKNDKMDGQGTYTWADGQKYQGEWKKGAPGWPGHDDLSQRRQVPRWLEERPWGRPRQRHLVQRRPIQSLAQGGPVDEEGQEENQEEMVVMVSLGFACIAPSRGKSGAECWTVKLRRETSGVIKFGGIKQYKFMVVVRDFPYTNALFRLVLVV